ncbi:hypothetical protein [Veillonella sp. CHU110]|uniref:hypothetical protein n=1 Tax=Veillonella sp. CHU110 TaxID=2490947 RepID=UPI000F8E1BC6|nr:hypothetical protein [Veillonella sp. CHU110]
MNRLDKKVLFVLATPMQIVTALHIINCYNLKADMICLEDHLPKAKIYANRLSQLEILGEVKVVPSRGNQELLLQRYTEIFITNNIFLWNYQEQLMQSKSVISIFDEGSMCYLTRFIEECYRCCKWQNIYLYEPRLANFYGDARFIIKEIPKIQIENTVLLEQLNKVFEVNANEVLLSDDDTMHVFFSQPFEHALSVKAKLRRIFKIRQSHSNWEYVLDAHKKYQKDIIEKIHKTVLSLYRKFHPREKERVLNKNTIQWDYPWELYLLHHPHTKVVQYSLFSSVLTASFVLGNSYDITNYYLYPIVVKELIESGYTDALDNDLLIFFDRLVKAGKVIPVYSLEELERIIQHEV